MPINSVQDTPDVKQVLDDILQESDNQARIRQIRHLLEEKLDFEGADQLVSLAPANSDQLPADAHVLGRRAGVTVAYIPLDNAATNRVTAAVAIAAARALAGALNDQLLLLFTNRDGDQLHIISPDLTGSRPKLQRLVAYRGQVQRTVPQQIANLWHNYGVLGKTMGQAIEEAFSVEPVTREFFETYRDIFNHAKAEIGGFGGSDDEQEAKHVFTQTLFNRLMFVYFLSRKGWLTFNGDTDYLNALWGDYGSLSGDHNFYIARLETLYFAGLNNPQSRDLNKGNKGTLPVIGPVPFLNGGLFERTDLDRRNGITVPDAVIRRILTGLFDRFNFTVMESTPFDVEVAVDPEMLGKVFEELVTERHASGAYYTPRPVVSFMCREALKGYLEGKETGASAESVAAFVDRHDTDGIGVAQARSISRALEEVTVVDPACGSGAYLLGMMQELIELQNTLYNVGVDAKSLYDLKLEIIQRNLYGVDIDDFAVNIAMLRLWLSLAIDYEKEKEDDNPPALPNLDFKVLCGDSLLGPDPSVGLSARDDETAQVHMSREPARLERLEGLKARFMRTTDSNEKDRLREEVEAIKVELRQAMGDAAPVPEKALDWQAEFAEVIIRRQGFDIAIANPPYIQLQGNSGLLANRYKDAGYQTFVRSGDIYQLFYERGCQILKESNGLLAYITSNSWLKAEYGKATRRYFSNSHQPHLLLELGKDVFESAIVDSGVLMLRTGNCSQAFPAVDMDRVADKEIPPAEEYWGQVRPEDDGPWSIVSLTEHSVLSKIRGKGVPIKDWAVRINRGVTTGLNKAFIIDNATKEALIARDPKSAEIIKPVLRGRDIQRFRSKWAGWWLVTTFPALGLNIEDYPSVKQHFLDFGKGRLEQNGMTLPDGSKSRKKTSHAWFELQDSTAYHREFTREKLLWIELVDEGRFAVDDSGIYGEATTFMMTGDSLKYLCALLNSTLIRWFLQQIAPTSGLGTFRWKKVYVETIPIPEISAHEQEPFISLVDEILATKAANANADTEHLEREIDRLVYELYGLTEEEVAAVEG